MTRGRAELERAKAEAQASRQQLVEVVDDIGERLSPAAITSDLVTAVREQGTALLGSCLGLLKHKPAIALASAAISFAKTRRARASARAQASQPHPPKSGDSTMTNRIKGSAEAAKGFASDKLDAARDTTASAYATARKKTRTYARTAREKGSEYAQVAREKAGDTVQTVSEGIQTNPLSAVLAGVAAGVLIGALLPRTRKETGLAKYSKKVTEAAKEAAAAVRDAGREALEDQGITTAAAKEKLDQAKTIAKTTVRRATRAAKEKIGG